MFTHLKQRLARLIFIAWGVHKPRRETPISRALAKGELDAAKRLSVES